MYRGEITDTTAWTAIIDTVAEGVQPDGTLTDTAVEDLALTRQRIARNTKYSNFQAKFLADFAVAHVAPAVAVGKAQIEDITPGDFND